VLELEIAQIHAMPVYLPQQFYFQALWCRFAASSGWQWYQRLHPGLCKPRETNTGGGSMVRTAAVMAITKGAMK
jgi:hypothetical protein